MKQWERQANETLRKLGEAYQLGRISRDAYRERRRRLLTSLQDQREVTARRAVVTTTAEHVPPQAPQHTPLPMPLRSHRISAIWRWSLLTVLVFALVAIVAASIGVGDA